MNGEVRLIVPSGDRFIDVQLTSSVAPLRARDVEAVIARLHDVASQMVSQESTERVRAAASGS